MEDLRSVVANFKKFHSTNFYIEADPNRKMDYGDNNQIGKESSRAFFEP